MINSRAKNIEEYLASLSAEKRATLERLRNDIRSAVPKAEECISYGIPAFRLDGRVLVHFGAASRHCAFYPGAYPIKIYAQELKTYELGKGTVRFPIGSPLAAALVRKLVKARVAEYGEMRMRRSEKLKRKTAR